MKRGRTLVELLVAIAVIVISVPACMSGAVPAHRTAVRAPADGTLRFVVYGDNRDG